MSKRKKAGLSSAESDAIQAVIRKFCNFNDLSDGDSTLSKKLGRMLVALRTDRTLPDGWLENSRNIPGDVIHDSIFFAVSKFLGTDDLVKDKGSFRADMHTVFKELLEIRMGRSMSSVPFVA